MKKKDFYIYQKINIDINGKDLYWIVCYEDHEVRVFDKANGEIYTDENGKPRYMWELCPNWFVREAPKNYFNYRIESEEE